MKDTKQSLSEVKGEGEREEGLRESPTCKTKAREIKLTLWWQHKQQIKVDKD